MKKTCWSFGFICIYFSLLPGLGAKDTVYMGLKGRVKTLHFYTVALLKRGSNTRESQFRRFVRSIEFDSRGRLSRLRNSPIKDYSFRIRRIYGPYPWDFSYSRPYELSSEQWRIYRRKGNIAEAKTDTGRVITRVRFDSRNKPLEATYIYYGRYKYEPYSLRKTRTTGHRWTYNKKGLLVSITKTWDSDDMGKILKR